MHDWALVARLQHDLRQQDVLLQHDLRQQDVLLQHDLRQQDFRQQHVTLDSKTGHMLQDWALMMLPGARTKGLARVGRCLGIEHCNTLYREASTGAHCSLNALE